MQRIVRFRCEQAVGRHHQRHIARLHRDACIIKTVGLEQLEVRKRALNQRLRRRVAVFFEQLFIQTSAIHADTDRNVLLLADIDHSADALRAADVAGVDANFGSTGLGCGDGEAVVKMDVRDERQGRLRADLAERMRCVHVRDGEPRDLTACGGQLSDLPERPFDVCRACIEHGLDGDRRAAAGDGAGVNLPCHKVPPTGTASRCP